ncbi:major facilitator superfamily domain-containing protein [Fusarium tricinctum]|uniref:Major facilitator superfamily domain-containing protein n=1 Tax=Fusarium tricinctum TaxID=61284 RepID=A0A8K0S3Z7_9HYPO|nr:major facilitator superfamily domain-containing protein [Fusarium tricinctum]
MANQRVSVAKTAAWLYHESGISAVYHAGRDAWLLILSRTCRMFAFKAVTLTIAQFFSELGFSDFRIGLFMSLTLLGDVVLGLVVTLMADGLGRRRVLVAGGLLMAVSGAIFCTFENFWVLLFAAVVGVVSASGSDFGPFRAIEESMLSHITSAKTRADVLAWYITSSSLGAAGGAALAGRFVETMTGKKGWSLVATYHATFWIYILMGGLNVLFALVMSNKTEAHQDGSSETSDESAEGLLRESIDEDEGEDARRRRLSVASNHPAPTSRFSSVSSSSRSVMYRLWFLLTIDSLADGMVSESLTTYFLDSKFSLSKATLGDIFSGAQVLATVSTVFAGPLSRHLGLINTMVFTHLPSSVSVLFFPFPSGIVITVILLYIRMGLNNMDQAPRSAFIAAVVKPEERTAVMGITATLRTLAMATGPSLTGGLAESGKFWIAFVVGGVLRIMYDLGLWLMFVNMKINTHETPKNGAVSREHSIDEQDVELLRESAERRRSEDH